MACELLSRRWDLPGLGFESLSGVGPKRETRRVWVLVHGREPPSSVRCESKCHVHSQTTSGWFCESTDVALLFCGSLTAFSRRQAVIDSMQLNSARCKCSESLVRAFTCIVMTIPFAFGVRAWFSAHAASLSCCCYVRGSLYSSSHQHFRNRLAGYDSTDAKKFEKGCMYMYACVCQVKLSEVMSEFEADCECTQDWKRAGGKAV